jgi:hypothetical protein
MFYEIGILCAIIIVGRLLFNWFDGSNALPPKPKKGAYGHHKNWSFPESDE